MQEDGIRKDGKSHLKTITMGGIVMAGSINEFWENVNRLEKERRIRTGGYKCPKCGVTWTPECPGTIHPTQIKGLFKNYPAYNCLDCGYTWKWTN